jgi:hypothetical protein
MSADCSAGGDSGIGRAVAVHFAREGADVAIMYLDEHKDADEVVELVKKEGRKCLKFSGDVSKPEVRGDYQVHAVQTATKGVYQGFEKVMLVHWPSAPCRMPKIRPGVCPQSWCLSNDELHCALLAVFALL